MTLIRFFPRMIKMYELRPYQNEAVQKTIKHFQKERVPAVIVLPTGAGKSLVIAELAKIANGRVLVLAHVKELVEQNHQKYQSYELEAGIFSAGLGKKEVSDKVIFGSIQSVARAPNEFFNDFSLVIIDECHRISQDKESQYHQVLNELKEKNERLCILGLTATPYRMGLGWIYEFHYKGSLKTKEDRFFKKCIFELSLSYMIKNNFLTTPIKIDSPVACYDFSNLKINNSSYTNKEIENCLKDQARITPSIIQNIIDLTEENSRQGVMIFTSTVRHAKEILKLLPKGVSELIVGDTLLDERDSIIQDFKNKKIKYLVNVSVLTTGFDAPHVDLIAILRPTESAGLYQQIIGRGLRLAPNKKDCLILDYTGQDHSIFSPEIGEDRPSDKTVPVEIECPSCEYKNQFWGIKDEFDEIIEHFGRQCHGATEEPQSLEIVPCGFRFRFKLCDQCNSENDIAARQCRDCEHLLVDTDQKLKDAMSLKDAHVLRPDTMTFERSFDKKGQERLEIRYYDFDAEFLTEYHYFSKENDSKTFYYNFTRMHKKRPEKNLFIKNLEDALEYQDQFRMPLFIIARKKKHFWTIREKIF
jgi:DNA repair protein RadD